VNKVLKWWRQRERLAARIVPKAYGNAFHCITLSPAVIIRPTPTPPDASLQREAKRALSITTKTAIYHHQNRSLG